MQLVHCQQGRDEMKLNTTFLLFIAIFHLLMLPISEAAINLKMLRDPKSILMKPEVSQVEIEDTKEGSGQEAKSGDTVVMKYIGRLNDGSIFDSGSFFEFTLGNGEVIEGWDLGIVGMKVGGSRKLIIPSTLGYGKKGALPEIPPNSELRFTVTLREIK